MKLAIIIGVVVILFVVFILASYIKAPTDRALIVSGLRKNPKFVIVESIKETTGFDLTEVMKANTYDAKTTKNVNFTGLPEEMSAAAKEPETDGKTE